MAKYVFGPGNKFWNPDNMKYNMMFVRSQETYAQLKFDMEGRLSFDFVLDLLGFDIDSSVPFTGWIAGKGDNFVDFGIVDYNPDHIDPNVGIEMTFNCPEV